jgi:hypothetical protein
VGRKVVSPYLTIEAAGAEVMLPTGFLTIPRLSITPAEALELIILPEIVM